MMYTARELAHYVVTKCVNDQHPISNLQLQKILYFLQVGSLKAGAGPAFGDEMQAWQFGPVVPSVYSEFGRYGGMPITESFNDVSIADKDRIILDPIIKEKRSKDAWELVRQSHLDGGPWHRNYGGAGTHNPIPLEDIEEYG